MLLTSVATDGGAREFFKDENSERKRSIYTASEPYDINKLRFKYE